MDIIAVGGSLGSFKAFKKVVKTLPAKFPFPIVYVFHQKIDSSKHVIELQKVTEIPVIQIEDGMVIEKSNIYLSPADKHTSVQGGHRFLISDAEPINYTRPSVDLFFESVAKHFGKHALAIVLSGGNKDGAKGAEFISDKKGFVWAQTLSLSEAKRMPKATIEAVASAVVLAPYQMAERLKGLSYEDFILRSEKLV